MGNNLPNSPELTSNPERFAQFLHEIATIYCESLCELWAITSLVALKMPFFLRVGFQMSG